MAMILQGISSQQRINGLTIQENTLNEACIEPISKLLKNRMPNNIEDLHILFCKMSCQTTHLLVDAVRSRC